MSRLGEDEHGVWLGARAGTVWRRGAEKTMTIPVDHLSLFPREAWWVATFNGEPFHNDIYVDISTAPLWPSPDEVTMVDLDLDVVRRRPGGEVLIFDEDEFADHSVRYAYPADVIAGARAATDWLADDIRAGREPWKTVYQQWFARLA
jgi:protein associated with RNAse G/E